MLLLSSGARAATAGQVAVTPGSVGFGTVPIGTTGTQTVQIKNVGGTSIQVWSIHTFSGPWTVSGVPTHIAAGATATITATYTPTATTTNVGYLAIASTAVECWVTVPLTGTGTKSTGSLSVSTSSLNFGNVSTGNTSVQDVTLKNTGNASISVTSVAVTGAGVAESGVTAPLTIAGGQSATLAARFSPKAAGAVSGSIKVVTTAASNGTVTIAVAGTGVTSTSTTHTVDLSWTPSTTSGLAGYNVYRSTTSGSGYTKIVSKPITGTTYADNTVAANTDYYYEVTAVTTAGVESKPSNQTTADVP
jgi:Abnormal spindle-like microcephaly-assoc'd, ASPM-SPD-2-Hydin